MATSKRELLLAEIQRVFSEVTSSDTGGGTTFGRVLDSSIQGRELQGQNVMGVMEGTETYLEVVAPDKLDRRLEVDLEVRAYVPRGVSLRAGANNVLADMEEVIDANNYWGGNAYATLWLANSVQREDTGDRTVDVTMFIAVQYRAKRSNPRG